MMSDSTRRAVQLDKNTGAKQLQASCNHSNLVKCHLLPRAIRDADDDLVLEHGISTDRLTVTFDRLMFEQNPHILLGRNPGLLLLRMDDEAPRRISRKTATKLLLDFKAAFPDWHKVAWRHSFIELTPSQVLVYATLTDPPRRVAL